jgi:hypothetical protein
MITNWLYFGCYRRPGHYLFKPGMREPYSPELRKLLNFDGILPPQDNSTGYVATVSRLEAWGVTALAFWDYTVDSRGGSNSVFYAPSLTITPDEMIEQARAQFPEVWARLPAVKLLAASIGVDD